VRTRWDIQETLTRRRIHDKSLTPWQLFAACLLVAFILGCCLFFFGSGDVEESANSAYSIGANSAVVSGTNGASGIHTSFGVPVFDTVQGTGDRLPYQASWAQSVTWVFRFLIPLESYGLIRSLIFVLPSLFLILSTLQSWLPFLRLSHAVIFGILANSSFALFLRQNEWSDHYVQVAGITAVSFYFLRREFQGNDLMADLFSSRGTTLCLFVSTNGVLTGHPGLWPAALFIWCSLLATLSWRSGFRSSALVWMRSQPKLIMMSVGASVVTIIVVVWDLVSEMNAESWGIGRRSRTQGLFSDYALGGLYGISDGGLLPEALRRVVASIIATVAMPAFILLDSLLPQLLRASDFRELARVEFSGAAILLLAAFVWKSLQPSPLRTLLLQVAVCQGLIWISVIASVLDVLPTMLASSGAWMTLTVVLTFNLFLSYLLIHHISRKRVIARGFAVTNVLLISYWCLIQFGFASFGSVLQVPRSYESRFTSIEMLSESEWSKKSLESHDRVLLISTPSFYDFLHFVSLGYPVVAPADPKMRSSEQLQSTFSFNYSINPPRFQGLSSDEIARTLDFLQIRFVLLGEPTELDAPRTPAVTADVQSVLDNLHPSARVTLPKVSYSIFERERFSSFVIENTDSNTGTVCPVLYVACSVVMDTEIIGDSPESHLRLCREGCLWTFRTPAVGGANRLVIPVTYDDVLNVHDASGTPLDTSNIGGFLGGAGPNGIDEGELTVTLVPDIRMLSRVFVSYLNLGVFLVLLGAVLQPWVQSRRRRLRIE